MWELCPWKRNTLRRKSQKMWMRTYKLTNLHGSIYKSIFKYGSFQGTEILACTGIIRKGFVWTRKQNGACRGSKYVNGKGKAFHMLGSMEKLTGTHYGTLKKWKYQDCIPDLYVRISQGVQQDVVYLFFLCPGGFVVDVLMSFSGYACFWKTDEPFLFGYQGEQPLPEKAWGRQGLTLGWSPFFLLFLLLFLRDFSVCFGLYGRQNSKVVPWSPCSGVMIYLSLSVGGTPPCF